MAVAFTLRAQNAAKMREAFFQAPARLQWNLNEATRLSLAEIQKREVDDYFQFKTPRKRRSGLLQRTFQLHTSRQMAALALHRNKTFAETFSTVHYADKVASTNNYYARILGASQGDITQHYERAIIKTLEGVTRRAR